ncbi:hypothetical protein ACFVYD_13120 [Streptomyces sp. NPDC058301]|uniref:hypothetical protein n=1 Tax=Streptomyces sp. NPDC058301 TaxID=3346436 RepID=UPI0036E0E544
MAGDRRGCFLHAGESVGLTAHELDDPANPARVWSMGDVDKHQSAERRPRRLSGGEQRAQAAE